MPNYQALKTELTTDPLKLDYAALLKVGNHYDLAGMVNALTGGGAAAVNLDYCSKQWFVGGISAAPTRLAGLSNATTAQKWRDVLSFLGLVDPPIPLKTGTTPGLLASAVADGVLLQAESTAITSRTGSRAEAIGFFDALSDAPGQVTPADIAQALLS